MHLAAIPSNPAHKVPFPPKYVGLYEKKSHLLCHMAS